jgi:LAS superfamily LD-carboxypeptidase LdcB
VTPAELTGRSRSHLAPAAADTPALHAHAVQPFENLRRAARADGLELEALSAFRDFERQLAIWNAKWNGTAPLFGAGGERLEAAALSEDARLDAILLWSALPGASRHHWGSDLDLIDRRALPAGYRVQLVPAEFAADGPFAALDRWLEANAGRFGFFRPFRGVRSGVRPEPWHLSFAPIAEPARRALTPEVLGEALAGAEVAGRARIRERLAELHARYVARIDWP